MLNIFLIYGILIKTLDHYDSFFKIQEWNAHFSLKLWKKFCSKQSDRSKRTFKCI